MGLRDILLMLIVFGSLPFILRRPYIGIIMWSWLSYMNPHRLTFGFAFELPFAQIVAVTTFVSIFFSREKISLPKDSVVAVWIMFISLICLSTIFALNPNDAWFQFIKIIKISGI